ncbi:hypothetical protein SAMN05519104_6814 [Rhizobiales bacterium GAS188]|nr:hypothetical protein SAMN05519104_6814 [Rhizobiales bacterium GAS188]
MMSRPPFRPFTAETAAQKARMAEDAWNSRDPARVALAYTGGFEPSPSELFLDGRLGCGELLAVDGAVNRTGRASCARD